MPAPDPRGSRKLLVDLFLLAKTVAKSDVVITTAQVQGAKAPVIVTQEMVAAMAPGSVIVDLAAEQGGNCAATVAGEHTDVGGVNVIGLQRAGMAEEDVEGLRVAFRRIYRSGVPRRRVLDEMKADDTTPKHVRLLIQALEETESGTKGRYRQSLRAEFARQGAERILGEVHEE